MNPEAPDEPEDPDDPEEPDDPDESKAPDNPEIPGCPGLLGHPGPVFITLLSHGAATCLEINADIEIQAARVGRSEVVA